MKRARRREVSSYMRRNVLNYKYIKKNILMTLLVVAISVMVLFVVRYGEDSDPYADELYLNEVVSVATKSPVMMNDESVTVLMDAVGSDNYQMVSKDDGMVSSAMSNVDGIDQLDSNEVTTEEITTEEKKVRYEATVNTDGAGLRVSADSQAAILQLAFVGDVLEVVEKGDSWMKVSLGDGSEAYIPADFVDLKEIEE